MLRSVAVALERTIAQRELRNDVTRVLREAEAGTTFTITVRGRPVARLGPPASVGRRVDVPRETLAQILRETPVDGDAWLRDIRSEEPPIDLDDDPWRPG